MNSLQELPELLRPQQAQTILGLTPKKYYALVEARPEFVVALPGSKYKKFRRAALVQLLARF